MINIYDKLLMNLLTRVLYIYIQNFLMYRDNNKNFKVLWSGLVLIDITNL